MTTTFAPAKVFLRVDDKFYPEFIDADQELKFGPSFLYLHLFRFCRYTDRCWPSQEALAKRCKCSVRSVQSYLQELVRLEYIEVLFQDGHNVYVLLLSSRVRHFLMLTGTTLVEEKKTSSTVVTEAKETHSGGENFSYYKRVLRNKDPLPPISPLLKPSPSTAPVCSPSSCRCQGDTPLRSEVGRGDSFSAQSEKQTHPVAMPSVRATRSVRTRRADEIQIQNADFDRLWAIWPTTAVWAMPRNRNLARSIFLSLARAGQLPPIDALLATVARFKAQDSRWKNGYPPELSSWLRGRGFEKEPFIRSAGSATRSDTHEAVSTALTAEQQHRLLELQKTCATPLFSRDSASPLSADVKTLCALWGTQTEPIAVFFAYLAQSGHKLHTSGLLTEAQAYLAETPTPAPLLVWLRDYAMRTAQ